MKEINANMQNELKMNSKTRFMEDCVKEYQEAGFILLNEPKAHYKVFEGTAEKEKKLTNEDTFDNSGYSNEELHLKVFNNINLFKNVMCSAEINSYKGVPFESMSEECREEAFQIITENLKLFEVVPLGYKIKDFTITVIWYLNDLMGTFTFSDTMCCINY